MKYAKRILMYGIPKSLLFKIIIALVLFIIGSNVFAQNVTSSVRCSYNGTGGTYYGDPNDGLNHARCYDTGSRYTPRLGYLEFYLPTSVMTLTAGKSYTVTMNMATNDWRNNIMLQSVKYVNSTGNVITTSPLPTLSNFRFVSKKQIKFDFKLPSGTVYPYLRFVISSTTYGNPDPDISSSKYITGDNNWLLSSIDISPVSSSSSGGSSSGSSSSFDDSSIINNNNQNTTDIINNNNQNTQDIIDNNTDNAKKLVDEIKNGSVVCGYNYKEVFKFDDMPNDGYLGSTGAINNSANFKFSDYTPIFGGNSYNVSGWSFGSANYYYLVVYDINKNFLFSFNYANNSNLDLTDYSGLLFIRINVNTNTGNNVMIVQNDGICVPFSYVQMKQNQETNNSISNVNDSINNSNIDSGTGSDFFDNFKTDDNGGISAIITKPLTLVNNLLSSNNQCSNLNLPDFMGARNVYLPSGCILWNNAPIIVINLWNIFACGLASYYILKDLFKIVENLKNPDNDKVEVIDL